MQSKKRMAYLRAKKKVEILKGFYGHLVVFILINGLLILINAGVFGPENADFSAWGNYVTLFLWGIGLVCHAIYVFFIFNIKSNYLKNWEEKKLQQFLEEDS